jgi:hypothetical protein
LVEGSPCVLFCWGIEEDFSYIFIDVWKACAKFSVELCISSSCDCEDPTNSSTFNVVKSLLYSMAIATGSYFGRRDLKKIQLFFVLLGILLDTSIHSQYLEPYL